MARGRRNHTNVVYDADDDDLLEDQRSKEKMFMILVLVVPISVLVLTLVILVWLLSKSRNAARPQKEVTITLTPTQLTDPQIKVKIGSQTGTVAVTNNAGSTVGAPKRRGPTLPSSL